MININGFFQNKHQDELIKFFLKSHPEFLIQVNEPTTTHSKKCFSLSVLSKTNDLELATLLLEQNFNFLNKADNYSKYFIFEIIESNPSDEITSLCIDYLTKEDLLILNNENILNIIANKNLQKTFEKTQQKIEKFNLEPKIHPEEITNKNFLNYFMEKNKSNSIINEESISNIFRDITSKTFKNIAAFEYELTNFYKLMKDKKVSDDLIDSLLYESLNSYYSTNIKSKSLKILKTEKRLCYKKHPGMANTQADTIEFRLFTHYDLNSYDEKSKKYLYLKFILGDIIYRTVKSYDRNKKARSLSDDISNGLYDFIYIKNPRTNLEHIYDIFHPKNDYTSRDAIHFIKKLSYFSHKKPITFNSEQFSEFVFDKILQDKTISNFDLLVAYGEIKKYFFISQENTIKVFNQLNENADEDCSNLKDNIISKNNGYGLFKQVLEDITDFKKIKISNNVKSFLETTNNFEEPIASIFLKTFFSCNIAESNKHRTIKI